MSVTGVGPARSDFQSPAVIAVSVLAQAERARVAGQLAKMRAEQDALRLKEGEAQRTLDAHQGEYSALDAELAGVEEARAEKVRHQTMVLGYARLALLQSQPAAGLECGHCCQDARGC